MDLLLLRFRPQGGRCPFAKRYQRRLGSKRKRRRRSRKLQNCRKTKRERKRERENSAVTTRRGDGGGGGSSIHSSVKQREEEGIFPSPLQQKLETPYYVRAWLVAASFCFRLGAASESYIFSPLRLCDSHPRSPHSYGLLPPSEFSGRVDHGCMGFGPTTHGNKLASFFVNHLQSKYLGKIL